jgi:hypothetical protein
LLHRIEVEGLELLGVVERLTHGIGQGGVLVEHPQVQLVRPPVLVRRGPNCGVRGVGPAHDRARLFAVAYFEGILFSHCFSMHRMSVALVAVWDSLLDLEASVAALLGASRESDFAQHR